MFAWIYRLFRLLFVYWKFRTNRIPAPQPPEERLREIDADHGRDLSEWDREFQKLYPPMMSAWRNNQVALRGMQRSYSAPTRYQPNFSCDVPEGWHHVPGTSRWEPDQIVK